MDLNLNFLAGLSCGLCLGISYFALKRYIFTVPEVTKAVTKTSAKVNYRCLFIIPLIIDNIHKHYLNLDTYT